MTNNAKESAPEVQRLGLSRSGPRTPHGKNRSRQNAIKTGIFAKNVLVGEPFRESTDDYLAFLEDLRTALRPTDAFESMLMEKLAFIALQLTRVYRADAELAPLLFAAVKNALEGHPTINLAGCAGFDTAAVRPDLLNPLRHSPRATVGSDSRPTRARAAAARRRPAADRGQGFFVVVETFSH